MSPTLVFVPGAWHSPTCFHIVAHMLQQLGYSTHFVVLPSVGADPPLPDMIQDVARIRIALTTLIESGQQVLLIMHSYGGVCGSAAVEGLPTTSTAREKGQRGGIVGLTYLASFLLPPGVSLLDGTGGKQIPWWGVSRDETYMFPTSPVELFYSDMGENEAEAAASVIKTHSYGTFTSKATYAAWVDIPATYVFCEKDQAIPIEVQRAMVERAREACSEETRLKTETLDAGHSPFLSQPDSVVKVIRRAAGEDV